MSQTTDTVSVPATEKPEKRCAIVGTARSWTQTPWHDLTLDIFGLNDGYALGWRKGWPELPRASGWFDLHPFTQMVFRPKGQTRVNAFEVPVGAYLRPEGHREWLRTRPYPVYLHDAPPDWPNARTFPRAELEAKYGTYFTSTPAWMLVWALEHGYTEIHIYGIHLASEWEYISQRPCMEFWIRHAIDRKAKIVLPASCPLLKSKHVYAYEPKPDLPLQAVNMQIARVKQDGAQLQHRLAACKFYERGHRVDLLAQLAVLNLELLDLRQAQSRVQTILAA